MVPADQCFDALRGAGGQIEDGLIFDEELSRVEAGTQIRDDREPPVGMAIAVGRVNRAARMVAFREYIANLLSAAAFRRSAHAG